MTRRLLYALMFATLLSPPAPGALGAAALAQTTQARQPAPSDVAAEASAQAAQPPLTFRVEANFVEVDALVSDATGAARNSLDSISPFAATAAGPCEARAPPFVVTYAAAAM